MRWITRQWVLFAFCVLALLANLAVIAVLAVSNHYNMYMYTYSNFLLVTVLLAAVAIGLLTQGLFEAAVAMVYAPIASGSALLVVFIVTIVIINNPEIYLGDTVCDGGTLTFDKVRAMDWILHGWPVLEVCLLHLLGYSVYVRVIMHHFNRSRVWWKALLYAFYFFVCPLIPLGIYSLAENPAKQYPTSIPAVLRVLIALGLNFAIQLVSYIILIARVDGPRNIVQFYSDAQLTSLRARLRVE